MKKIKRMPDDNTQVGQHIGVKAGGEHIRSDGQQPKDREEALPTATIAATEKQTREPR